MGKGTMRGAHGGDTTASLLAELVLEESWVCLVLLDEDFRVMFVSPAAASFLGMTPSRMVGRQGEDFLPADYAAERRAIVQSVVKSGQALVFYETLRGWRCRTHVRPLPPDGDGQRRVAVMFEPVALLPHDGLFPPGQIILEAKINDGDLVGKLTPRQRELLGYIGLGYSSGEIAEIIKRAVKTVEFHRAALGRKLGVSTRAELALIAIRAGLVTVQSLSEVRAGVDRPRRRTRRSAPSPGGPAAGRRHGAS